MWFDIILRSISLNIGLIKTTETIYGSGRSDIENFADIIQRRPPVKAALIIQVKLHRLILNLLKL